MAETDDPVLTSSIPGLAALSGGAASLVVGTARGGQAEDSQKNEQQHPATCKKAYKQNICRVLLCLSSSSTRT